MNAAARPRLRPELRFIKQEVEGNAIWLVKDPASRKYFRFGALEAWIMRQLDGATTLQDICTALASELGLRTTPEHLDALVRRLRELGLVERSAAERSVLLMEQLRQQRRVRSKRTQGTLLRLQFSFGNPDRFFDWCVAHVPWFWTPAFVLLSAALFTAYGALLLVHWSEFVAALGTLYHPGSLTVAFAVAAYLGVVGLTLVHELGHGLTCKRFGGEVHDMGAMLLYFTPAFYCNVNDAWSFPRRSHRLWVTFAGGWIELVAATLATLLWLVTEPGTLVNGVALFTAAFGGGLALLLNYNPLIPLDGYYALVDWLELPNLRARSYEYTGALLKRKLLGLDVKLPVVTDRERRVFLWYGILSPLYVALLLGSVATLFGGWLFRSFGGWGLAAAAFGSFALTASPRRALARLLRVWWAEKRPTRRLRLRSAALLALLLLPLLAAVAPWTVRATSTLELEPAERTFLRAPAAAHIADVRIGDGSHVAPGDTVLLLHDPELRVRQARAASTVRALERRAATARAVGNSGAAALLEMELQSARTQLRLLERQEAAFALLATTAGVLVAPRLTERLGTRLAPGDSAAQIWRAGPLRGRLRLAQRDAGGLLPGNHVRVRFPATGGKTLHGRVAQVEPLAAEGVVQAVVALETVQPQLRTGMRGRARVDLEDTSVAAAILRLVRRTFRLDLLL